MAKSKSKTPKDTHTVAGKVLPKTSDSYKRVAGEKRLSKQQIRLKKISGKAKFLSQPYPPPDLSWSMYRKCVKSVYLRNMCGMYTLEDLCPALHTSISERKPLLLEFAVPPETKITSYTHRGHGHCLAKGGELNRMMAEIMERKQDTVEERADPCTLQICPLESCERMELLEGFGIAEGAALSSKLRGTDQVSVCFWRWCCESRYHVRNYEHGRCMESTRNLRMRE